MGKVKRKRKKVKVKKMMKELKRKMKNSVMMEITIRLLQIALKLTHP